MGSTATKSAYFPQNHTFHYPEGVLRGHLEDMANRHGMTNDVDRRDEEAMLWALQRINQLEAHVDEVNGQLRAFLSEAIPMLREELRESLLRIFPTDAMGGEEPTNG